jgi:D-alanyl-D-alanine carboxypeptidase
MKKNKLILVLLLLIIFGVIGYLGYRIFLLRKEKFRLENELSLTKNELSKTKADFASTKRELESIIDSLRQELAKTEAERADFEQKYNQEKERMDFLASQVENLQSTAKTFEKLAQTDPELLKKYSKVYFLNENYVPESFIKIPTKYTFDPQKDYLVYSKIWPFLKDLLVAAENDGINLRVISAYRSFGTQSELKSSYLMTFGTGANKFSADQGYSEHQLGTALDFTTAELGANFTTFDKTTAYQWLLNNAYKYGFILSYPEGNQYYQFEPWHWRFVSRALATRLHEEGKNFYDLDQREIDKYLISFFD